jgi:hypothetical protein
MLGWFDAREAKQFGASIAALYVDAMPVSSSLSEKKFAARSQAALSDIAARIEVFKRAHRLNIYTKAQLSNTFKWALKDAGYGAEYLDKLTDWLITRL